MWSVFEHWALHSSIKQDLLCGAGFANFLTVALALPCLRCVSSVQHIPSRIGRPQANLLMNYGKHRHYAHCKSHICSAHQYRGLDVSRRTSTRDPRDSPGDSSERRESSSPRGFCTLALLAYTGGGPGLRSHLCARVIKYLQRFRCSAFKRNCSKSREVKTDNKKRKKNIVRTLINQLFEGGELNEIPAKV